MPVSININGCKCQYTGKESDPTGLGHCSKCYPEGTIAIGKDKNVWVIKTTGTGDNVWAKVPKSSIHKDRKVWRCTDCIQMEETPVPTVPATSKKVVTKKHTAEKKIHKVFCVGGICKVQPKEARYYEFTDPDVNQSVTVHGATYGDILSRQNSYKCEETYIINKHGIQLSG